MQFLLTNDDGIHAPGIAALREALLSLGQPRVVAPHEHHSGCSHRTTTDRALQVEDLGEQRFALDGTPADCTRIGLLFVAPEAQWVISGVNEGGNLGVDVCMSGTVAAAREAALLGKPAIALSQYRRTPEIDWARTVEWTRRVVELLLPRELEPGAFWNVNFPDSTSTEGTPEIIECPLDPHPLPVHYETSADGYVYRGRYHERGREQGSDVDVCFNGAIAVTQVSHHSTIAFPTKMSG